MNFAFSGPVRDVSILYPGTSGNYLRPQAAAQGGLFWVHRYMQAAGILNSNREITWASRKPAGYKYGYKPWESIFSWLMGYVNAPGSRTRAGWFNIPRMADPDFWRSPAAAQAETRAKFAAKSAELSAAEERWLELEALSGG